MSINDTLTLCQNDVVLSRKEFLRANRYQFGLGPEDLILIKKKEGRFFQKVNDYSKSVGGFPINSQASFAAYFSHLTNTKKKNKWLKNEFITQGRYYSWNSFSMKDVVITVDNPGGCTSKMEGDDNIETELTSDDWYQVSLSSKLRFYRCSQPLLSCIMFSKSIQTENFYVHEIQYLDENELNYAADHHSPSEDFETALAFALIINCSPSFILSFLDNYGKKFPRILYQILRHISPRFKFSKMLLPSICKYLDFAHEDLHAAIMFVHILINHKFFSENNNFKEKNEYLSKTVNYLMPLIHNSLWASPNSAALLAYYCIENQLYVEALNFLNLSFFVNCISDNFLDEYANKFSKNPHTLLSIKLQLYKQKFFPHNNYDFSFYELDPQEKFLLQNPLLTLRNYILSILGDMITKLGFTNFYKMKLDFLKDRKVVNETFSEYIFSESSEYSNENSIILTEEEKELNSSRGCIYLNDNENEQNSQTSNHDNFDVDDFDLFDPGIEVSNEFEAIQSYMEVLKTLPLSKKFVECIHEIMNDFDKSSLILAQKKVIHNSTAIIKLSLCIKDQKLEEAILNTLSMCSPDKDCICGVDKLLLLKSYTNGITTKLDDILTLPINPPTQREKNALSFMIPFAIGVHRLNNTEI